MVCKCWIWKMDAHGVQILCWMSQHRPGTELSGSAEYGLHPISSTCKVSGFPPPLCILLFSFLTPHTQICPYYIGPQQKLSTVVLLIFSLILKHIRIIHIFLFHAFLMPTKKVKWPFCSQLLQSSSSWTRIVIIVCCPSFFVLIMTFLRQGPCLILSINYIMHRTWNHILINETVPFKSQKLFSFGTMKFQEPIEQSQWTWFQNFW